MLELKKLENDNAYEEKLKKQQKTREIFDANLRQKMKRRNREMQEEIALDTKIMEMVLAGFEAETNMQHEKKVKIYIHRFIHLFILILILLLHSLNLCEYPIKFQSNK